ncbi:hypothetical protein TSOC_010637 [Tetrabaena socialis]|uniref:Uncharacterized protein n=1 Tax=Tetrabaena socialis TaxID=47790 RepID=A0A2J7ZSS3_9CHLO|nr:hypothetical protein TSOC_010637 [Tetrabaena socialis]|eukprot:PNH03312.1 hypothetical protein TSOC_010637 [Tetrabaena socialis]
MYAKRCSSSGRQNANANATCRDLSTLARAEGLGERVGRKAGISASAHTLVSLVSLVSFAAGLEAKQRVVDTTSDYCNTGALRVAFANGDQQSLPLLAEMLHPRLEVKPRKLDFKNVHLQSPKTLQVVISNPTTVDAAWAVTVEGHKPRFPTLPGAGAAASGAAAALAGEASVATGGSGGGGRGLAGEPSVAPSAAGSLVTVDAGGAKQAAAAAARSAAAVAGAGGVIAEARIGPYIVRPASGVLPGRGLLLPHTQVVSITFAPTEAELYEGELLFAVLRGKACSVDVDGVGSTEETDEHKGRLYII